ncbi:pentapeptide repeat-containing protein [Reticulibacter mediterranei]|uniref:pentapeptide repeat-containing protein n=1 Tax=Reticulibacter mediterranei TaxID=2778369 RepID=UPI001C68F98D|nr:pentapeptide repeat-containing protein [Reticulibacter mediterranei]
MSDQPLTHVSWTEQRLAGKTVWQWLSLLLIPLLLWYGTIWMIFLHMSRQSIITVHVHAQESVLEQYSQQIDTLLLEHHLRQSFPGMEVSDIAHARTLNVLKEVDAPHRRLVIAYLSDLHLIQGGYMDSRGMWQATGVTIGLWDADLSGVDLGGIDLSGAQLERADLDDANLTGANLRGADLADARLARANLSRIDLRDAQLIQADLTGATLTNGEVQGATLERAEMRGATLLQANLAEASLWHAHVLKGHLSRVFSLSGTTLSDGSRCHTLADLTNTTQQAENRDACLASFQEEARRAPRMLPRGEGRHVTAQGA